MAELAEEGDDDDDHSPSAGSAASLELYQSVRGLIPDGHVRDKDQISMKSDCATGLRRRLSILNAHDHKVGGRLDCSFRTNAQTSNHFLFVLFGYTPCLKKRPTLSFAVTLTNIDRFSQFFYWYILWKIRNNVVISYPTTRLLRRRCTTL